MTAARFIIASKRGLFRSLPEWRAALPNDGTARTSEMFTVHPDGPTASIHQGFDLDIVSIVSEFFTDSGSSTSRRSKIGGTQYAHSQA